MSKMETKTHGASSAKSDDSDEGNEADDATNKNCNDDGDMSKADIAVAEVVDNVMDDFGIPAADITEVVNDIEEISDPLIDQCVTNRDPLNNKDDSLASTDELEIGPPVVTSIATEAVSVPLSGGNTSRTGSGSRNSCSPTPTVMRKIITTNQKTKNSTNKIKERGSVTKSIDHLVALIDSARAASMSN